MKIVRASVLLLAVAVACIQSSTALAYVLVDTPWASPKTTFNVDIPGANGLWNTTFEDAMAQWSSDTVFAYSVANQFGDPCSDPNSNPYVNGVAFSSTFCGDAWGTGVVAVTATWSLGGVRKQAGISFNSNRSWNVYTGPVQSDLDFRRVAVHELGHALGLGHEDVQPAIMRPDVGNIENPTADDIAGVEALYDNFVPLPFAFIDQTNVTLSATITSGAVTISGIASPTAISVTGGTYSIGCGSTFKSTAGTISNNQTVCVRHTSAPTASTATNTLLSVGGVSDTFTSTTLPADTTPDAFSFTGQANVALSTAITSSAITVTGINAPAAISVAGGEYAVNGGVFTAVAATVSAGNTVIARVTSSATPATAVAAAVTIGGVTGTFTVTTAAADTAPDAFSFADQPNVALSTTVTSAAVTITGISTAAPISVTGGSYSIGCSPAYTTAAGTISNNQTICLRHTSAPTAGTATNTALTIGGVSDTFTSITTAPAQDSVPEPFTFTDVVGAPLGTPQTSNAVTIADINTPSPISVTGGTYSIGCSATFTAVAGTISSGQTVCVQQTSSATNSVSTDTTLTIGGVADTFTVRTTAASGDIGGGGGSGSGGGGGVLDGLSLLALGLMGVRRRGTTVQRPHSD